MADLLSISNGDAHRSPKVYFCAHPDDQASLLDPIAAQLQQKCVCTLWYPADPNAPRDEAYLHDLSRMLLFVVPVTTRLLTTENVALHELRFATEHHIPVLPLMQEEGLSSLFNEKCGKLHFLEEASRDSTAISYRQKLDRFLSATLFGIRKGETVEKAFDAHIFLSYRKKDRRHAQKLMELIHRNEQCRRIAVWYDEFLIPGEDFNDAIRDALLKSDLVVMAVTPNLVNESNYIMTTEYPLAQENRKPILAFELVPTDREALELHYAGLSACIDAYDGDALAEALLQKLPKLTAPRAQDPEKDYCLGLAYLYGIDVEVNHAYAAAYLTSAANAGHPGAISRLAEMYRTGLGVAQSYKTALFWDKKNAVVLKNELNGDIPLLTASDRLHELLHRAACYEDAGESEGARYLCERLLQLAEPHAAHPVIHHFLALCCDVLGSSCRTLGDMDAAKANFLRSLSLREALAAKTDVDIGRELADGFLQMGSLYREEGELAGARRCCLRALDLLDGTDERQLLCVCHRQLGELCRLEGSLPEARQHFEHALSLAEAILADADTPQARRTVLLAHLRMGDICRGRYNWHAANDHYLRCLRLAERLMEENDTLQARRDLSLVCGRLSSFCTETGTLFHSRSAAEAFCRRELAITEAIVRDTKALGDRRSLLLCYQRLGGICEKKRELADAKAHYGKSLDLSKAIYKATGTQEAMEDVALSLFYLAMAGDENRLSYLQDAVKAYETLRQASPTVKRYQTNLSAIRVELKRALRKKKWRDRLHRLFK